MIEFISVSFSPILPIDLITLASGFFELFPQSITLIRYFFLFENLSDLFFLMKKSTYTFLFLGIKKANPLLSSTVPINSVVFLSKIFITSPSRFLFDS